MGSVVTYAAVNAKVKALEGNLLSKEEFQNLLNTNSFTEALRFLKEKTSYEKALRDINIEEIHRGELEIILKKYYIKSFHKLSNYFNGVYKKLLKLLFVKYEIEDLKVIIRGKYIGRSNEEIEASLAYSSPLNTIDYKNLLAAKTVEDVVERLKGSIYYDHIYPVLHTINENRLFQIETYLDFVYFSQLRKFVKKLNKEDREIVEKFTGTQIDLMNIDWIYRGKKYYDLSTEELFNYTIYGGYKLNNKMIKELCYSKSVEDFILQIENTPYGEVVHFDKGEGKILERELIFYLKKMYEGYKKQNKLNIASLMAYLQLFYIEVRDIFTVVENKRYGMDSMETSKYINTSI